MSQLDHRRRRQLLLDRFLAGEIDQPAFDRLLAQIDEWESAPVSISETPTDTGAGPVSRPSLDGQPTSAGTGAALSEGTELGKFRIERRLGRGGMGEVWKAHDRIGDRPVVIKILPPELQSSDEEMARVRETFRRIHALQHEHICPVHDLGEDPRLGFYLVMKFLDADTLSHYRREYAKQHGGIPVTEVVRLLEPVARALDYSHAQKVVHRDIKPQNVLVSRDGRDVQVVDFGLAAEIRTSLTRLSQTRMETSGTYPYMAPEQWRGEHQDGRADQYALGAVAYELLSGRLPFDAPDPIILRQCVLSESVASLSDHTDHVNAALRRGLAKRRDDRFATCVEFIAALSSEKPQQKRKVPDVFEPPAQTPPKPITAISPDVARVEVRPRSTPPPAKPMQKKPKTTGSESQRSRQPFWTAAKTGSEERRFDGHTAAITGVAFAPDGRGVYSGSVDGRVRQWELEGDSAQIAFASDGSAGAVRCLTINSAGTSLAVGCADGRLRLVEMEFVEMELFKTTPRLFSSSGHTSAVECVAFSPDGTTIASGGADAAIRLWSARSRVEVLHISKTLLFGAGHDEIVTSIAFAPDERSILSGSVDCSVRLWDGTSGRETRRFQGHRTTVTGVAFLAARQHAVSCSRDGLIAMWDLFRPQPIRVFSGHRSAVECVTASPNGPQFLSGGQDGTIHLWDSDVSDPLVTYQGHAGAVTSLAFAPDGRSFVSGGADKTVRVWQL